MTNLASYIDHTLLSPDAAIEDIHRLCQEALDHAFYAVCVPPFFAKTAVNALQESPVKVATVVGFPMGYSATSAKVEEIKKAIADGVKEVDVVVNRCAVKSNKWNLVQGDLESMTVSAQFKDVKVKAILETSQLNDEELKRLCEICSLVGVDFVKTSTGLSREGATVEGIRKIASWVDEGIAIKASGGIRTREQALTMIEAGASRIGTSSGVTILKETPTRAVG